MDTHTTSRFWTSPSVDGMLPVSWLLSKSLPERYYCQCKFMISIITSTLHSLASLTKVYTHFESLIWKFLMICPMVNDNQCSWGTSQGIQNQKVFTKKYNIHVTCVLNDTLFNENFPFVDCVANAAKPLGQCLAKLRLHLLNNVNKFQVKNIGGSYTCIKVISELKS